MSSPGTVREQTPEKGVASPSSKEMVRLYRQMALIRRFEQTAQVMYRNGELPGFIHLYIGEEATAVGVMAHLRSNTSSQKASFAAQAAARRSGSTGF